MLMATSLKLSGIW